MFQKAANEKGPRLSKWHGSGKCFRVREQVYIAVRSCQRANGQTAKHAFQMHAARCGIEMEFA